MTRYWPRSEARSASDSLRFNSASLRSSSAAWRCLTRGSAVQLRMRHALLDGPILCPGDPLVLECGLLEASRCGQARAGGAFAGRGGSAFGALDIVCGEGYFAVWRRLGFGGHDVSLVSCGFQVPRTKGLMPTPHKDFVSGVYSAGGGTRTLKLFRAMAPKTIASANFATPAACRSYRLRRRRAVGTGLAEFVGLES